MYLIDADMIPAYENNYLVLSDAELSAAAKIVYAALNSGYMGRESRDEANKLLLTLQTKGQKGRHAANG